MSASPQIAVLDDPRYGVCLEGRWRGWLFRKHPDGHWISQAKLNIVDATADAPFFRTLHEGGAK